MYRLKVLANDQSRSARDAQRRATDNAIDRSFGFERIQEGPPRLGWLVNMRQVYAFFFELLCLSLELSLSLNLSLSLSHSQILHRP